MNKLTKEDYIKFVNDNLSYDIPNIKEDDKTWLKERSYHEEYALLYKLCEELCRKFGTKIVVERSGPTDAGCTGYYRLFDNIVRVKGSLCSDVPWDTISHEFGHVITGQYRLLGLYREEPLLAEKFDPQKIRREITDQYNAIQRYCFAPYIQAVENVYGAGAFDVILNHSLEHVDLNWMLYHKKTEAAEAILKDLEACGYVDALIKYIPIIKKTLMGGVTGATT